MKWFKRLFSRKEKNEVVVRHRHPDNLRRNRKDPIEITNTQGIIIPIDLNASTLSVKKSELITTPEDCV